jgi:predicted nucleic acid-binding protein
MEMEGLDKVLVDTSAWIDFFRQKEPIYSRVSQLLDEDRICCLGIILAELIQGTRSKEEIKTLKDFIFVFPFLKDSTKLWEKAGELSFTLKRAGMQVGLSDCYIATAASDEKAAILTLDEHFKLIKTYLDLTLC